MDVKELTRDIASSVRGNGPYKNSDKVEAAIEAYAEERVQAATSLLLEVGIKTRGRFESNVTVPESFLAPTPQVKK